MRRVLFYFLSVIACMSLSLPLLAANDNGGSNSSGNRNLVSIQGMIFDNGGNPLNRTLQVTFRLYEEIADGQSVWEEAQLVSFAQGVYSVSLGAAVSMSADLFNQENLYLGVQV